jgi:hypothetical protein
MSEDALSRSSFDELAVYPEVVSLGVGCDSSTGKKWS